MVALTCAIRALFAGGSAFAASPDDSSDNELNNGEDFTRPPARWDLSYQFQDKADDVEQNTFTLRRDQPFVLGGGWKLATRFDIPFVQNDKTSRDNPNGDTHFGTGDDLVQAILIDSVTDRFAAGAGMRAVFPTANEDQFGAGKYQLLPIAGAREKIPELSVGSFAEVIVRYDTDVGGYGGRSHIKQLQFSPTFNLALPDRWFVTLFPSQDFVVNLQDNDKWFVPADVLIGRNLTKNTVATIEVSVPIVKQYVLYDFKLEAHISFSF